MNLYTDVHVSSTILPDLFDPHTDIAKTVLLEEQPLGVILQPGRTGTATILSYTPNTVTVSTQTNGDMILFLSDTYYPGWKAYVDRVETKLYRANYTFRAVPVPAGDHTVDFRYEPESWKWGVIGSMLGLLLCVALYVLGRIRK